MSNASQPAKHPRKLKTHEAMKHLFHPDVIKHVKKEAHPKKQARPTKTA
jgi:hypothetical protein